MPVRRSARVVGLLLAAGVLIPAASASPAEFTVEQFTGEGQAEPVLGRCAANPTELDCTFRISTRECDEGTLVRFRLGRTGPAQRSVGCGGTDFEVGEGDRLRESRVDEGFRCAVEPYGSGIARAAVIACRAPSGHGFGVDASSSELTTPALNGPGGRTIVLGGRLGPVRLGMSEVRLRRVLGGPTTRRSTVTDGLRGVRFVQLTFEQVGGLVVVAIDPRRGVVQVFTDSPRYATRRGVGAGVPLARVRREPALRAYRPCGAVVYRARATVGGRRAETTVSPSGGAPTVGAVLTVDRRWDARVRAGGQGIC